VSLSWEELKIFDIHPKVIRNLVIVQLARLRGRNAWNIVDVRKNLHFLCLLGHFRDGGSI
jgi:hypothetical protein